MPGPPPFCKDCKHHSVPGGIAGKTPRRSEYYCNAVFDPVTGEQLNWSCQNTRGDQMECGRDGKLFEPIINAV